METNEFLAAKEASPAGGDVSLSLSFSVPVEKGFLIACRRAINFAPERLCEALFKRRELAGRLI